MWTILLIVLVFWAGLPGFFLAGSVWAARRSGELPSIAARYSPLVPQLALSWVDAVRSTARISLSYPFSFLLRRRPADLQGPPILLVHGLYHNPTAWLAYRHWFRRDGFSDLHVYGYNSFTQVHADLVQEATRKALAILEERPGQQLILVGHSLGGLVIRGVAARPELQGRVRALACLGTPHHGSILAAIGIGRLARSLHPRDPLFARLGELDEPDVPKLAVYTPLDHMVFPPSGLLPPSDDWTVQEISPRHSHVGMIYSKNTYSIIFLFLRSLTLI